MRHTANGYVTAARALPGRAGRRAGQDRAAQGRALNNSRRGVPRSSPKCPLSALTPAAGDRCMAAGYAMAAGYMAGNMAAGYTAAGYMAAGCMALWLLGTWLLPADSRTTTPRLYFRGKGG